MKIGASVYIGKGGALDLKKRTYENGFGEIAVPPEVFSRGNRMYFRNLYDSPFEYVVRWCDYQQSKALYPSR